MVSRIIMFDEAILYLKNLQNIVFGTLLHCLGLHWSADDYLSNLVGCGTPRNDRSWMGKGFKFDWVIKQLLKPCGAILKFDDPSAVALRSMENSLYEWLTDFATVIRVNLLFYNQSTPIELLIIRKAHLDFQNRFEPRIARSQLPTAKLNIL